MRKDRAITLGEGKGKQGRTLPRSLFRQHDRFARYSRRWFRRVPGMEGTSQALLSSGTSADPVLENGLACPRRIVRDFLADPLVFSAFLPIPPWKLRGIRAKPRDSVSSEVPQKFLDRIGRRLFTSLKRILSRIVSTGHICAIFVGFVKTNILYQGN